MLKAQLTINNTVQSQNRLYKEWDEGCADLETYIQFARFSFCQKFFTHTEERILTLQRQYLKFCYVNVHKMSCQYTYSFILQI
jgi:hypothetical protein